MIDEDPEDPQRGSVSEKSEFTQKSKDGEQVTLRRMDGTGQDVILQKAVTVGRHSAERLRRHSHGRPLYSTTQVLHCCSDYYLNAANIRLQVERFIAPVRLTCAEVCSRK